jgi:predicted dienelactone hydrolase
MKAFEKVTAKRLAGIAVAAQVLISPAIAAAAGNTAAKAGDWGNFDVGSRVVRITGTVEAPRPIDVLFWYPADKKCYAAAVPTVYASRLNGIPIIHPTRPDTWVPMSFVVPANRARNCPLVDAGGASFPLIVYSHPAMSDPQNPAYTLERLASHGFIIAAPWHYRDTQDDQRIDLINPLIDPKKKIKCFDGGESPCLDTLINKWLPNRALDLSALLDAVPSIFGDRVDMERIGVLGQSRGSLTALAAAGGSSSLKIKPEPRIKAIMTLTIGARPDVHRGSRQRQAACACVDGDQQSRPQRGHVDRGGRVQHDQERRKGAGGSRARRARGVQHQSMRADASGRRGVSGQHGSHHR